MDNDTKKPTHTRTRTHKCLQHHEQKNTHIHYMIHYTHAHTHTHIQTGVRCECEQVREQRTTTQIRLCLGARAHTRVEVTSFIQPFTQSVDDASQSTATAAAAAADTRTHTHTVTHAHIAASASVFIRQSAINHRANCTLIGIYRLIIHAAPRTLCDEITHTTTTHTTTTTIAQSSLCVSSCV